MNRTNQSENKKDQNKLSSTHVSLNREASLQCAHLASQAALDKKAEDLKLLDLSSCGGFTDFFVICSGTSDRHVSTIMESVEKKLKENGFSILGVEGKLEGRWIVMDCGGVIVHVFLDALRTYYSLESLWEDATECPIPAEFYAPGGTPLSGLQS